MPRGIHTTVVGARLTDSILAALEQRAKGRGISISAMLAIGIEEWLYPDAPAARTVANGASSAQSHATPEPPPRRPTEAIIAGIDVEVRIEQKRPLGSVVSELPTLLDSPELATVTDLRSARAAGPEAWLAAGCGPGLAARLFPDDHAAHRAAKLHQGRIWNARHRANTQTAASRIAARYGLSGQASVALNKMLAEKFAGLSVEDAIAQGSEAWLDVGVSEGVARALFDEPTAVEARRRNAARDAAAKRDRHRVEAAARSAL